MPVLRQKRTVTNAPIGVARINTGEAELWETIRANAKNVASTAFTNLKKESLNEAQELALNEDIDKVRTINPTTGKLEALELYNMNSDARVAYKRIIDSRFEKSISDEIQLKSKEFALINKISPQAYEEKFSQYLAGMVNNAPEGMYKGMIEEAGTFYLASTKMNLTETRRKEALVEQNDFIISEITQISDKLSITLLENERNLLLEKSTKLLNDGLTSGAIGQREHTAGIRDINLSSWKGIIQTSIEGMSKEQVLSKSDVTEWFHGIKTGDDTYETLETRQGYPNSRWKFSDIPPEFRSELVSFAQTFAPVLDRKAVEWQAEEFQKYTTKVNDGSTEIYKTFNDALFGRIIATDGDVEEVAKWRPNNAQEMTAFLEQASSLIAKQENRIAASVRAGLFEDLGIDVQKALQKDYSDIRFNLIDYMIAYSGDSLETISTALSMPNRFVEDENGKPTSKLTKTITTWLHNNKNIYNQKQIGNATEYVNRGKNDRRANEVERRKIANEAIRINIEKFQLSDAIIKEVEIIGADPNYNMKKLLKIRKHIDDKSIELGLTVTARENYKIDIHTALQNNMINNLTSTPEIKTVHLRALEMYIRSNGSNANELNQFAFSQGTGTADGPQEVSVNYLQDFADSVLRAGYGNSHEKVAGYINTITIDFETVERAELAELEKQHKTAKLFSRKTNKGDRGAFDAELNYQDRENWPVLINSGSDDFSALANRFVNGSAFEPDFKMLLEFYGQYNNFLDSDTQKRVNLIRGNSVLTDKQIDFIETISGIESLTGSKNIFEAAQLLGNMSAEDKALKIKSFLFKEDEEPIKASDFILESIEAEENILNPVLYKKFNDYFEYMVAAGYTEEGVKERLKQAYEEKFVIDNTILDVTGARTALSFDLLFVDPEINKFVKTSVETDLNKLGYTLSDKIVIRPESSTSEYMMGPRGYTAGSSTTESSPIVLHHLRNIAEQKTSTNESGELQTVFTTIVQIDGNEVLIPTVWDGAVLTPDAAIQRAIASGIEWPSEPISDTAVRTLKKLDKELHERINPISIKNAEAKLGINTAYKRVVLVPNDEIANAITWWPHEIIEGQYVAVIINDADKLDMPGFSEKELRDDFETAGLPDSNDLNIIEGEKKLAISNAQLEYARKLKLTKPLLSESAIQLDTTVLNSIDFNKATRFDVGEGKNKRTYTLVKADESSNRKTMVLNANNNKVEGPELNRIMLEMKYDSDIFDSIMDIAGD